MKRTELKRTPLARTKGMRKSKVRMTAARKAAKGQDCTLQYPGCRNDRDTVVLCHLRQFGGGGIGIKPHDSEGVLGCSYCHDILDGRVALKLSLFDMSFIDQWEYIARALIRTIRKQRESGILIFKGEE